jgi:hypothetical protein
MRLWVIGGQGGGIGAASIRRVENVITERLSELLENV